MDKRTKERLFESALLISIPILVWIFYVSPLWKPLFFGLVLAILFSGLNTRLRESFSDSVAALVVILIAFVSTVLPISFGIYYIVVVANELVRALQDVQSAERAFIADLLDASMPILEQFSLVKTGTPKLEQVIGLLSDNLNSIAKISRTILGVLYTGVIGVLFGLTVILFTLFYLLVFGSTLASYIKDIAPVRKAFIVRAYDEFAQMTRVILKVTVIIGVVQGTIGGVGLWVVGTPSAFMWTIVMMLFSMMPILGAGGVLIPTALVYLALGEVGKFGTVVGVFVLVSLIDNFLKPRIVGQDTSMNGGMVLLGVIGGLYTFGAIGMFAGPIILAMLIALWDTYHSLPMQPADEVVTSSSWKPFQPRAGKYPRP